MQYSMAYRVVSPPKKIVVFVPFFECICTRNLVLRLRCHDGRLLVGVLGGEGSLANEIVQEKAFLAQHPLDLGLDLLELPLEIFILAQDEPEAVELTAILAVKGIVPRCCCRRRCRRLLLLLLRELWMLLRMMLRRRRRPLEIGRGGR